MSELRDGFRIAFQEILLERVHTPVVVLRGPDRSEGSLIISALSLNVACRSLMWPLPAAIVTGRSLTSPRVCGRWLSVWLLNRPWILPRGTLAAWVTGHSAAPGVVTAPSGRLTVEDGVGAVVGGRRPA